MARTASPAPAPAETVTPSYTFEDAPVPEKLRETNTVNPFTDAVKGLAESMGDADRSPKALTFVVPIDQAKTVARQLITAGSAAGVTVRQKPVPTGDGKSVKVTFFTVKKITRKPKDETATAATESEAPTAA